MHPYDYTATEKHLIFLPALCGIGYFKWFRQGWPGWSLPVPFSAGFAALKYALLIVVTSLLALTVNVVSDCSQADSLFSNKYSA